MSYPDLIERWQRIADYVLPVLLGEGETDGAHEHFWKATGNFNLLASDFPPGKYRNAYIALSAKILCSEPVDYSTLQVATDGKVDPNSLALWFAVYKPKSGQSSLKGRVFEDNVKSLMSLAETVNTVDALQTTQANLLEDKANLNLEVSALMNRLNQRGVGQIQHETASESAQDYRDFLNTAPDHPLKTGVAILDLWIGGLAQGQMLAIIAAMKQRKTSLLLNILLHMVRKQGQSVALLMFESNKHQIVASIVAMFAMEYLIQQKLYDPQLIGTDGIQLININAAILNRERGNYRRWDTTRVQAVDYGLEQFYGLKNNLRIYDRTATGGGLSDCHSIERVVMRDKRLYGTNVIAIDHAQRVDVGSASDYEILNIVAKEVEKLTRRESLTSFLLAQIGVAKADSNQDRIASGVRGGSALDEAVDHMIATSYREKQSDGTRHDDTVLGLRLHHSRFADAGSHKKAFVGIDPNTGLILNKGIGIASSEL